jgi:phosphoglycolate phosphatase-like HAD superfamily hydrolase
MNKLVILDFDDTLISNMYLDFQSFKIISKKLECYIPKKNEIYILRKQGHIASKIIDFILKKSKKLVNKESYINNRKKFLESNESVKFLKIQPYVKKFLKKLKKNNFCVIIATLRKNENIIRKFIKNENIDDYIDHIYCNIYSKSDTRKLNNAYKIKKKIFTKILNKKIAKITSIGNSDIDKNVSDYFNLKYIDINSINKDNHAFRDLYRLVSD